MQRCLRPAGPSTPRTFSPWPLPVRLPFALTLFSFPSPQPPRPHPVGYCSRLQEGHSSEVFPGSPLWTRRAFAGIQGWKICVSGTRPRRHGKGNGKPRGKTTGRSGTVREERASVKEESPLWGPASACPAAPAIYSRRSCVCILWGGGKGGEGGRKRCTALVSRASFARALSCQSSPPASVSRAAMSSRCCFLVPRAGKGGRALITRSANGPGRGGGRGGCQGSASGSSL